MASTKRSKRATKRSALNDRPRERARVAEEENRNLCLELETLRANYEAALLGAALAAIEAHGKSPREWVLEASALVRAHREATLTKGVKQDGD